MKVAVVSSDGSGAWFATRFQREGNDCDYFLLERDKTARAMKGLCPPPQFDEPKKWSEYDLVVFDGNSDGKLADRIRKKAPVIGCSELSCRLENDRLFGLSAMEEMGIAVPAYESFDSPDAARKWIEQNPDRYVYKPFQEPDAEDVDCSVTFVSHSASEMEQNLDRLFQASKGAPFLLQRVVDGTEISTEAYFDGSQFHFANATLEEKKFLAGNLGQNVGCAGNIVWPYRDVPLVFSRGLLKARDWLREREYRGMIDLNSIVTRNEVYGLEWTPRLGFHASATLLNLLDMPIAEFLLQFADAPSGGIVVDAPVKFQFGAAIDISVPPFPYPDGKAVAGEPIDGVDPSNVQTECYLYDAMLENDRLMTAGICGWIGAVLSRGHTFRSAWQGAMDMVKQVKAPDIQWRNDLEQSTGERFRKLKMGGWL